MNEYNGYYELGNAIVQQAVLDYLPFYIALKEHRAIDTSGYDDKELGRYNRKLKKLEREFDEIIDFIYSPWFKFLTDISPLKIIDKLEKEVIAYESKGII